MVVSLIFFFFFFQAEDGIRDAQESRGLGDVYKRQGRAYILTDGTAEEVVIPQTAATVTGTRVIRGAMGTVARDWPAATTAVSYTHLTLPTIYSV